MDEFDFSTERPCPPPAFLCAKEVANQLGVSERTAARVMRSGELESFRVGKLWRTSQADVAGYVARQYERYGRSGPCATADGGGLLAANGRMQNSDGQ